MALLETDDLSLTLDGARILRGLSLRFDAGRTYAVVGPNGAGKSTLATTLMGLDGYRDFTGDIRFEGTSLRGLGVD